MYMTAEIALVSQHPPDVFYYESMKRNLKTIKPIYECRCNGRLQTKRFTRLTHIGFRVTLPVPLLLVTSLFVSYESRKRELKTKLISENRCNERLKN